MLSSLAARAEDWKVESLGGSARMFSEGAWTDLRTGDGVATNALVQTAGRLRLMGETDALDLGPGGKISVEEDDGPLVRVFAGSLGAQVATRDDGRFLAMTTFASVVTRGASFGVVAETYGATVSVREGLVSVTDLLTRKIIDVKAGQTLRVRRGEDMVVETARANDPAMEAAKGAPADPSRAAAQSAASGDPLDRRAVGAIKPMTEADAKLANDAADKIHDAKRKGRLGKADPKAVAAAARITRELFQDIDVEVQPWDDSFEWTEVEDGQVRLKPISRILLSLTGPEALEFWFLACVACLFLGALASAVMEKASLGVMGDALLIALAFVAAILIRDAFFRAGGNITLEPFLSVGMILAAMPLMLLGGAYAKLRLP